MRRLKIFSNIWAIGNRSDQYKQQYMPNNKNNKKISAKDVCTIWVNEDLEKI
jgi:hypothetical protein